MKIIKLTKGFETIVDDDDFDWLSQWKWRVVENGNQHYAIHGLNRKYSKGPVLYMHRVVLNLQSLDGQNLEPKKIVDHKDQNGLNNQKSNLRLVNKSKNAMNSKKRRTQTSSKFKGVWWSKEKLKWYAYITANKKRRFLGYFFKEKDAAEAYDRAAVIIHDEFCSLNFKEIDYKNSVFTPWLPCDYCQYKNRKRNHKISKFGEGVSFNGVGFSVKIWTKNGTKYMGFKKKLCDAQKMYHQISKELYGKECLCRDAME